MLRCKGASIRRYRNLNALWRNDITMLRSYNDLISRLSVFNDAAVSDNANRCCALIYERLCPLGLDLTFSLTNHQFWIKYRRYQINVGR